MPKKVCTKCGKNLPLEKFYKDLRSKSGGLRAACIECYKVYAKRFSNNNPEYMRQWRKANRGHKTTYEREYRRNRPGYNAEHIARRESQKLQAQPTWLHPVDLYLIKVMYYTRPDGYHVDHIVPLRSDKVCGLHVPWNLQHLPESENVAKGNYWWPDMW